MTREERNKILWFKHKEGVSLAELARSFGITQARVKQVCATYERRIVMYSDPIYKLAKECGGSDQIAARIFNVLQQYNIASDVDDIKTINIEECEEIRNVGKSTMRTLLNMQRKVLGEEPIEIDTIEKLLQEQQEKYEKKIIRLQETIEKLRDDKELLKNRLHKTYQICLHYKKIGHYIHMISREDIFVKNIETEIEKIKELE